MALLFDILNISTKDQNNLSLQTFIEKLQNFLSNESHLPHQKFLTDILNLFNDKQIGIESFNLFLKNSSIYDNKFKIDLNDKESIEPKIDEYLQYLVSELSRAIKANVQSSTTSYTEIGKEFKDLKLTDISEEPKITVIEKPCSIKPLMQILVLEDDAATKRVYQKIFSNISNDFLKKKKLAGKFSNINCTFIENGIDGIAYANNNRYDFILTDNNMPGKNGSDVIIAVRTSKDSKNKKTPILANSDDKNLDTETTMRANGATQFIKKPLKQQHISDFIDKYVLSEQAEINENIQFSP